MEQEDDQRRRVRAYEAVDTKVRKDNVTVACLEASTLHEPFLPGRVCPSAISYEVKASPHHCRKALLLHDQLQHIRSSCRLLLSSNLLLVVVSVQALQARGHKVDTCYAR